MEVICIILTGAVTILILQMIVAEIRTSLTTHNSNKDTKSDKTYIYIKATPEKKPPIQLSYNSEMVKRYPFNMYLIYVNKSIIFSPDTLLSSVNVKGEFDFSPLEIVIVSRVSCSHEICDSGSRCYSVYVMKGDIKKDADEIYKSLVKDSTFEIQNHKFCSSYLKNIYSV